MGDSRIIVGFGSFLSDSDAGRLQGTLGDKQKYNAQRVIHVVVLLKLSVKTNLKHILSYSQCGENG